MSDFITIGYQDGKPLWARDTITGKRINLIIEEPNEEKTDDAEVHEEKYLNG